MAATLISATDLQWGVKADETGMIIEKVTRTFKQKKKEVLSKQGETIGLSAYDKTADITISGLRKGDIGLAAVAIGATDATIANDTIGHGVTGGKLFIDEVTEDEAVEDFVKIDIKATRYPLISPV